MKVRTPHAATTRESSIDCSRTIVEIDGCCGWDIADRFAVVNDMTVPQIGKLCDMQVCADHVIVDTDTLEA